MVAGTSSAGLRASRARAGGLGLIVAAVLAACGGGKDDSEATAEAAGARRQAQAVTSAQADVSSAAATSADTDAVRLANQASFGPTDALLSEIKTKGATTWVKDQMALNSARYTSGGDDAIHKNTSETDFCSLPAHVNDPNCWRDWYSSEPLVWDFYRNALGKSDQLRQRVALALQQILVVSEVEISGTYGLRNYHNALLDNAFGNYRQVLKKTILSPVMGDYLNHVNNDKLAPNENFARELLQLFSLGTCKLNRNGKLTGGSCQPTYDNDKVREYAFALTGLTYPAGGATAWGCWPEGANCQYYGGDMAPAPALRNTEAHTLLSGVTVPANATPQQAVELVLDSLMNHQNIGPFVGRRLIQHLVMSNPPTLYIDRVATAFNAGRYTAANGQVFGTGTKGDLAATVAAVLLDDEARTERLLRRYGGSLRPPVLLFTGVLRAMGGTTDGDPFSWWWGEELRQHLFRPPSVFNFYPPDYPVAGTQLVGPEFGIHNANTALERLNYLTYLFDWDGSDPNTSIPNATGTKVNLSKWAAMADNPATLVDSLSMLALGKKLAAAPRTQVINAVAWWTPQTDSANWRTNRARAAAYLVFASPDYQVQR